MDSGNGEKRKYMKDVKEEELGVIKMWRIREQGKIWMTPWFLAWAAVWMKVLIIKIESKVYVGEGMDVGGRPMGRKVMHLILDMVRQSAWHFHFSWIMWEAVG